MLDVRMDELSDELTEELIAVLPDTRIRVIIRGLR